MTANQLPAEFPDLQAAIYGVALSLDAFLLNGIPYGVIQRAVFTGFVENTAGDLLREIGNLETLVLQGPFASHRRVAEVLALLRARCQQLIDVVAGLSSFRSLPLQQLRSTVSQIPLVRGECEELIQELEACLH